MKQKAGGQLQAQAITGPGYCRLIDLLFLYQPYTGN